MSCLRFQIGFVGCLIMFILLGLVSAKDIFAQNQPPVCDEKAYKDYFQIDAERSRLLKKVAEQETRIKAIKSQLPDVKRTEAAQKEIEEIRKKPNKTGEEIKKIKDSDEKVSLFLNTENQTSQQLESELQQLERDHPTNVATLQCIDSVIKTWLSPEGNFRLWMSGIFAALIGLVIAGFFLLAYVDMKVRRAVFAGQVGLQFLALFSIIIAIILFGITKILEARELAALLGSLAGYILGRHTAPGRGEGNSADDEIEEFISKVSKIKISPAKASLDTNKPTEQLTATPADTTGKAIKSPTADAFTPQWKSSDIAVASVDSLGKVTRKSAGTCNVTADFNDITSNICVVTCK